MEAETGIGHKQPVAFARTSPSHHLKTVIEQRVGSMCMLGFIG